MKTTFPATVMVFGVVSSEGHIMPPSHLRSRLESQHQSVPGCTEECGNLLVLSGGRWQTLGVAAGLGAGYSRFSVSTDFVYTQLNVRTIQFSINTVSKSKNSSI